MCAQCFKLASEEARYKILTLLKREPLTVTQLTEQLHAKQPTVTHHLKLLHGTGLLHMEKRGKEHVYSLALESECYTDCGLLNGLKS